MLAGALLDPAAAMASTPTRALDPEEAAALANGRALAPTGRPGPVAAVGPDGRLVAVVEDRDGRARPRVVLA
jgi:tRNA pseudouridine55 synthase